jgi:transcriptional/translational regulatory protein YebC/TACO1
MSIAVFEELPLNTKRYIEEIEKLIDKLEDDDDVQAVYTNIS